VYLITAILPACTAPAPTVGGGHADDAPVEDVGGAPDTGSADPGDGSADVFDPDTIHTIDLTLADADWQEIATNPWAETWHTGTFRWEGETVADVAVRAFGYSSHVAGKPPLKIDFDAVVPGQEWRGLEQLKLRNSYLDASFLHDALGPWLLRRAGVPASRTGWARLTVNGVAVGFYTVMESIDDRFLKRQFGNDDGPLYSIDGIRGHGLMPLSDPLAYFQFNTSVTGDGSDLVDLTRIVATGSDDALAAVVDLDTFFDESIVRTLSGSQDAFSADGNNFYLYDDPGEDVDPTDLHGTWHVIPWDYNFDFTTFGLIPALSVEPARPWATSDYAFDPTTGAPYEDVLMERQIASGRDVDAEVRALATGPLAFPDIAARVGAWRALVADDVATDPIGGATAFAHAVDDDLLYLHMRLSNTLGAEVATCASFEPDAIPVRDLAPAGTVGWSTLTTDGWVWSGQPGSCVTSPDACHGFDVADTHYCTGLFAHAPSTVTITVPAGTLRGAVGLQLFGEDCSTGVQFRVEQGGATLWQSGVLTSYSAAEDLGEIPLVAGTATLVADPLGDYSCDTASWVDVRLVP
jgi:hypothetical protein